MDQAFVSPPSSALERASVFALEQRVRLLPPEVVTKAKMCVIDALSAALTIGSAREGTCALALAAAHSPSGPATIFGTDRTSSAADAAFVNATTAAGTSRSDTHPATASHPGPAIIPPVLALAEAAGRSGSAAIEAIVAGYEVMCRLGLALITPEFAKIFRPTGMIAPTASALAAGRVLGLDSAELRNAASLATHTASGLNEWANSGTPELPYHSGFAARNGVDCALLAQSGMVSAPTILEGKSGLLAGYGARERAHLLTDTLGREYKILEIVHKPAPACIFVQTPSQAADRLARKHRLAPDDIRSIEIRVGRAAALYPGCDNPGPVADPQAAKLSIQFGVASVIAACGIFDANWREFENPTANALAARATVTIDDALTAAFPGRQGCAIGITLSNGDVLATDQADFVPMTEDDLVARFFHAAEPKLGRVRSERILDLVRRLEQVEDMRELGGLLRAIS